MPPDGVPPKPCLPRPPPAPAQAPNATPHPGPAAGAPPLPPRPHFFLILLNSAVDSREPVR